MPNRSITSSTIGETIPPAGRPPAPLLAPEQQDDLLHLLLRGASPAGAVQEIGVSVDAFTRTFSQDEEFRRRVGQIGTLLSQNVAAALYRAAMEGSVSAQTFWLKSSPPPGWSAEAAPSAEPDSLDRLSDDELIDLARAMGIDIPPEITKKADRPGG